MLDKLNVFMESSKKDATIREQDQNDLTLDGKFKEVFSNKRLLAVIVKHTIEDFQDCSYDEIVDLMEGFTIECKTSVKASVLISTESHEDGCTIKFDIRTSLPLPKKVAKNPVYKHMNTYKIILNVEMQRSANPKYNLGKRGIYYISRSISTQLDRVDNDTDYNQVQPVHSIWIVINSIPKHLHNKVIHYKMINYTRQQDPDYVRADKRSNKIDLLDAGVDMLHLHYIFLNSIAELNNELDRLYPSNKTENYTGTESILEFLTLLFTNSLQDDRMSKYLDSDTINRSKERIDSMTTSIKELERERAEGREEGREEGRADAIIDMALDFGYSTEEILSTLQKKLNIGGEQAEEYLRNFYDKTL